MVSRKGAFEVECCRIHLQRIEYIRLHGTIVSSAEFHLRVEHVGAGVSRGCGHQIGILEEFTELRGRLHGPEERERALGRDVSVLEYPFEILARHSSAGADQVFDENTAGCLGVTEPKRRKQCCDRRLPSHSMFIDQLSKQEFRHCLRIRGHHEQGIRVGLVASTKLLGSESISEYDFAVLY